MCKQKSHFSLCYSVFFMLPAMSLCYTFTCVASPAMTCPTSELACIVNETDGPAPIMARGVLTNWFLSHWEEAEPAFFSFFFC